MSVFLKEIFEKVDFQRKLADDKRACQITQQAKSQCTLKITNDFKGSHLGNLQCSRGLVYMIYGQ